MFFEEEIQASKELEAHTPSPPSASNLGVLWVHHQYH